MVSRFDNIIAGSGLFISDFEEGVKYQEVLEAIGHPGENRTR
jgi:hypothetical protein